MKRILLLTGLALGLTVNSHAADFTPEKNIDGWQLIDAQQIHADGGEISKVGFSPAGWFKATVPGTVLTSLVDDRVYPEPLYGENNRSIPESLCHTSYWYRTEVSIPANRSPKHYWLNFKGINYLAEVFVNGKSFGEIKGAFTRGAFDVSSAITAGSRAAIAVHILPPPHPGTFHEHTVAAGTGRNGGAIGADSPTFLATVGWDWIPGIRDRDMGIWAPVGLKTTGPVKLDDPQIRCKIDEHHLDHADLLSAVTLTNLETHAVAGDLKGYFDNGGAGFSLPVTLNANESKTVTVTSKIAHPKLWWPNGYGAQTLYKLKLRFLAGGISDEAIASFGIHSMRYFTDGGKNLTIIVNGVPIFCKGGNWGMDEAMKRSPLKRLDAQIRMHHDANITMIRNWIGMSTEEDFYDLCDKYGILIWDDFWLANPVDGPNPVDPDMFLANAREKILRYRNHPSVAVWCGRNEGDPPRAIDAGLAALIKDLDPDRIYQKHSAAYNGVGGGGPYSMISPERYFTFRDAFHTEIGAPSIPTLQAVEQMMPEKDWWPLNDDWAEHDLCRGAQRGDRYPADVAARYGPVTDLKSFVRESQMANYETYRAMFEGRNSKLFNPATGVLLWMSNPCQPSFVWQLYSYDLEPNASEFAAMKACEPIHVQFNPASHQVEVVNNSSQPLANYKVRWQRLKFDGQPIDGNAVAVNVGASSATDVLDLSAVPPQPYFLNLQLVDSKGRLSSHNFYWESAGEDFTTLQNLPSTDLSVSHVEQVRSKGKLSIRFTLANPGKQVALLAHVQLRRGKSDKRVLPVFYSDNYVTLLPGESRRLEVSFDEADLSGDEPTIHLDGWNVAEKNVQTILGNPSGPR